MAQEQNKSDFWVFGYGSLMWNPGFEFLEERQATMRGVHRAPCIYSWVHRGTKEQPGVVLGLDRGGSCTGRAFRVSGQNSEETIAYLRARELVTNVYIEVTRPIQIVGGERTFAVTYVADRTHEQYAGRMSHDELIQRIANANGKSGPNDAYFLDTARKLEEMNIKDNTLSVIAKALGGSL